MAASCNAPRVSLAQPRHRRAFADSAEEGVRRELRGREHPHRRRPRASGDLINHMHCNSARDAMPFKNNPYWIAKYVMKSFDDYFLMMIYYQMVTGYVLRGKS